MLEVSDGSFYGTAVGDNFSTFGTVYLMDAAGAVTPLHAFDGTDGSAPFDGLVRATDGSFYGTTLYGGDNDLGTLFSIDSMGTFTSLHSFDGTDGSTPYASPVQASDGDFYGVTSAGGAGGVGTVYRFDGSTVTTLHSFTGGGDGSLPSGRLVEASDGLLYGTTAAGGSGSGTIFRIDTSGDFATLHTFDGSDGATPTAKLTAGSDGALYGTANYGGLGTGTVFRLVLGPPEPPSLTAISPASGPATGGKRVAIAGAHLSGASAVSFGGVAATPPAVPDQGTVYTVAPDLPAGTLNDVTVALPAAPGIRSDSPTLPAAWFADFGDIPQDDPLHSDVESIFRSGITAGCGGGFYCRDLAVTRAQMAAFLLKAEHGSGYVPPVCAGTFSDVPCPSLFADWIEQLSIEGITGGCGGGQYCPNNPVTRRRGAGRLSFESQ